MNKNKMAACLLLALMTCSWTLSAQEKETVVDQVVAVVGKHIVKLSDVEQSYNQIRRQQGYVNPKENRCMILDNIMLNKLLVHKAEVDSIMVEDAEVEEMVERYLTAYLTQYGSKEALKQASGYSYDEMHDIYFDLIKESQTAQKVQYQLTQNVKITPKEVSEFFNNIPKDSLPTMEEEYELSEICLTPAVSEEERERIKFELNTLRERVLKGERFATLATLYSEDPGSAKNGGELGFFTRGKMVHEFEAAAFALKPGEVSPIIETKFGFHILQLIERRGNMVNVRHILMMPKVSNSDMLKTRMRLDSIATEIRKGAMTFDEAAKRYSDGSSKSMGGVLSNPNSGTNRFAKSEAKTLFPGVSLQGMNESDISNATAYKDDDNKDHYRILRLNKKVPEHTANLTDDYDKIYAATLSEAKQNKVFEWANRMVMNTYVRLNEEYHDCDFKVNWIQK